MVIAASFSTKILHVLVQLLVKFFLLKGHWYKIRGHPRNSALGKVLVGDTVIGKSSGFYLTA